MNEQLKSHFSMPPVVTTKSGEPRRVGFELEFSGIDLATTVAVVHEALRAEIISETEAEVKLSARELGTFNIEIDWAYLKTKAAENSDNDSGGEWVELLSHAATKLVPVEVVCPPIPVTQLATLAPMVNALRSAGAVGTEKSLISAYGVHINTEIPDLDAAILSRYLRAFALLQWWLSASHGVNLARRISPYIDPYPDAYLKQVLSRPASTMDQILSEYLEYNPTRNRELDLLPLLAEVDEDKVRQVVDDPRIEARPAFHYRLPDCHIERVDWSLQVPWNSWLVVERLAARPDDIEKLALEFMVRDRPLLNVSRSDWVDYIDQWLRDRELA